MTARRLSPLASPEAVASMLVGILAVVLVATQVFAAPAATPGGSSSRAPSSSASAAPSSSPPPASPFPAASTLSPLIRSSLTTILDVNQGLAGRASQLNQVIAAGNPRAEEIATILRAINTDMVAGTDAANRLLTEPATAELGDAVVAFYQTVAGQNAATLGTSIRVVSAYVDGARKVIKSIGGIGPLNEQVQASLGAGSSEPPSSVAP